MVAWVSSFFIIFLTYEYFFCYKITSGEWDYLPDVIV